MHIEGGNLENSEIILNNTIWIEIYLEVTDDMIDYMADVIIEAITE